MATALHCDGPGCDTWTIGLTDGWWHVARIDTPQGTAWHFCSPNCMAAWAAAQPWTEEVA